MSRASAPNSKSQNSRRKAWPYIKWSLFALVMYFVVQRGMALWNQDELANVEIDYTWLFAAALAYLMGWLPAVWFWQQLILAFGSQVNFLQTCRAYFPGHLGKYIPGKATVVVIRATMLKDQGVTVGCSTITVLCETLITMGSGLVVGLAMAPWIFPEPLWKRLPSWLRYFENHELLFTASVVVLSVFGLSMLAQVFSLIVNKMLTATRNDVQSINVDARLLIRGLLVLCLGWVFHGLSLGFTLLAVDGSAFSLADWPACTATISLATSVSFFVLIAPGGLGIREGLIIEFLSMQPGIGAKTAIVAAVLLRVISLVSEIVASAILYYAARRPRQVTATDQVDQHTQDESATPKE
jgi:hypothetical protein